jgi:hypothetical protein
MNTHIYIHTQRYTHKKKTQIHTCTHIYNILTIFTSLNSVPWFDGFFFRAASFDAPTEGLSAFAVEMLDAATIVRTYIYIYIRVPCLYYIYIYVCMYMLMFACMIVCIYVYACMYVCVHMCMILAYIVARLDAVNACVGP